MKSWKLMAGVGLVLVVFFLGADAAWATQTGPAMPWDGPLNNIMQNLTGRIARIATVISIVLAGISYMFAGEIPFGRAITGVAIGGAVALGAIQFMTAIGLTGAVLP
jgi:type IV secretory pathway VirB2 component (pilin)